MTIDLRTEEGVATYRALVAGRPLPRPVQPIATSIRQVAVEQPSKPASRNRSDIRTALPPRLVVEFDVPVRAVSEANAGGKLGAKIARKVKLKAAVAETLPVGLAMPLPVVVTLTRLGGKQLDQDDNLPRAMKAVKDVIARWLGVRDTGRDARVKWRYRQAPAWFAGVRVRIEHRAFALDNPSAKPLADSQTKGSTDDRDG